ncbi:ribose transport system substrate-binding protein [Conexibacter arvalis]|uniref:Ribose transport system substrate-binding protein n=1 Tax=Conexibacter arvalis TaxID=912552 RepID=A0A840ICG4_9ACTN|nr:ribose transport system substrate-binding protein [Conexibacter arvalis]
MKRFTALAALVAVALLAVACGSSDDDGGGASTAGGAAAPAVEGGRGTLGVVAIDLQNSFFVKMKKAGDEAAADYGVKANWQSAQGSVERQISIVESMIRQRVGAILVDPIDKNALKPVIAKATAAGIPFISMGNKVEGDGNHNTLYPDYEDMAQVARALATSIGGEGEVGMLVGGRGNFVSDTRERGFVDTLRREFPEIEVVSVQPTDFEAAKATDVATTWATTYPNLKGFSCTSDYLCLAAQSALQNAGMQPKFAGHDGDAEMAPFLEDGSMVLDVLTGGERVGYWNIAVAARLAAGRRLPTDLYMPTYLIAGEQNAADLAEDGLELETVTPARAEQVAQDYRAEFGPDEPDAAMTVGEQ